MTDSMIITLVFAVVAAVVVGVAAYFIIRYMRGSIKLLLSKNTFSSGEDITGRFEVLAKKPIKGKKLTATLLGTETIKTYKDGKSHNRTRQIYKKETIIENARTYHSGFRQSYKFPLAAPELNELNFMKSDLGKTLKTAMNLLGDRRTIIKWHVAVRLDAVGIDLAATKSVSINI